MITEATIVQKALDWVQQNKQWTVILCPDGEAVKAVSTALISALPLNIPFSGRTAKLPGGNVSVACVHDDIFIPDGLDVVLIYYGWKTGDSTGGLDKWAKRALHIIRP